MEQDDQRKQNQYDWIKVGGIFGGAILFARITRTPMATVLGALPFLLPYLRRRAEHQQQQQAPASGQMTREEAALILGIPVQSEQSEVRDAHRRLIQKNHPDQGGSDYLAAKINQARDVLLKKV